MRVEGRNAVHELLKTDTTIDTIFVQNGMRDVESRSLMDEIKQCGIKITFVDKAVLDSKSNSKHHQGFVAVTSDFVYSEMDELVKDMPTDAIFVILDGIEDVHNLGSIIRVCECAGVYALVIGKHRSASVNDTVMRISEGSCNHIKIAKVTNINQTIDELKENGVWAYALELGGDDIYRTDFKGKIAIVIGGEDTGVNKLTQKRCDKVITIPMCGKINSLNASVACGIAVFEAVRNRNYKR